MTHSAAQHEAERRFGRLGVAYRATECRVGVFRWTPFIGPPPWPIVVYGSGRTFEEAFATAAQEIVLAESE